MVLSATAANNFTVIATNVQDDQTLQREVDLTERSIRNAGNRQQFTTLYDARLIGNPSTDPQDDSALTPLQIAYRDAFVNAGYLVTLDADSGLWRLSWEDQGAEQLVSVYSIRTTVVPGAIADATIDAINTYFNGQIPVVRSQVSLNLADPGGDTDEADFGATTSSFYEYIAVAEQQDKDVDLSNGIRTALVTSPLGYQSTPSNVFVYRLA